MVLVDTSIWIDHLRKGNLQLKELLISGEVACHPFIIGELACGNLKNRKVILSLLNELPRSDTATENEIIHFIDKWELMGQGLGIVDVHLLSSALLTNIPLWTYDKRLNEIASKLNVSYEEFLK
jgi:predicted nucleic acid-binding protein